MVDMKPAAFSPESPIQGSSVLMQMREKRKKQKEQESNGYAMSFETTQERRSHPPFLGSCF